VIGLLCGRREYTRWVGAETTGRRKKRAVVLSLCCAGGR